MFMPLTIYRQNYNLTNGVNARTKKQPGEVHKKKVFSQVCGRFVRELSKIEKH